MIEKFEDFNFEVAFSFHSKDQTKAVRINNLLKDRYKTFIYTERQRELIGAKGDEKFKKAFQFEARVVVVLYCKEWGNTPWTMIESDAIRARGYETGYDFLILIPTESDIPKWLHPTYIWGNFKRYGIKGAAAAIENKIQLLGGEKKDLTPEDIAKWIDDKSNFTRKRSSMLNSFKGVENANKEIQLLFNSIEKNCQKLNRSNLILNFKKIDEKTCSVLSTNISMRIMWNNYSWNSLEDRSLSINILEPVKRYDAKPIELKSYTFLFDYSEAEEYGWIKEHNDKTFFTSQNLGDFMLKEFLKIIYELIG
jgi:hypothetical protein